MDIDLVMRNFGLTPVTRAALCALPRNQNKLGRLAERHLRMHERAVRTAKRHADQRRLDMEEIENTLAH